MPKPECVDCIAEGIATYRPVTHGGPRSGVCTTHHRARRKTRSARSHALRTAKVYGISEEQYWTLYAAQGGTCYVCQRATGATKRLAVDHDHETGAVRALLCGPCNQMIGRLGPEALARAILVLKTQPAQQILGVKA